MKQSSTNQTALGHCSSSQRQCWILAMSRTESLCRTPEGRKVRIHWEACLTRTWPFMSIRLAMLNSKNEKWQKNKNIDKLLARIKRSRFDDKIHWPQHFAVLHLCWPMQWFSPRFSRGRPHAWPQLRRESTELQSCAKINSTLSNLTLILFFFFKYNIFLEKTWFLTSTLVVFSTGAMACPCWRSWLRNASSSFVLAPSFRAWNR